MRIGTYRLDGDRTGGEIDLVPSDFVLSILAIGNNSLTLPAGSSVALPIAVSPTGLDEAVSVTISGLTSYESVTDNLDHTTFSGGKSGSVTLTAAEVNSGLSLNSSYTGSGKPVNTLSVTASTTIAGETATTAPQSITVTDPPVTSNSNTGNATADCGTSLQGWEDALSGGLLKQEWEHLSDVLSEFKPQDLPSLLEGRCPANATLGYGADKDNDRSSLSDGAHAPNLALLGSYIASSFVAASDGHGTTCSDASQMLSNLNSMLAQPHT